MTSSSELAVAPEVVRHRVAGAQAAARSVRSVAGEAKAAASLKVIDRIPPPPPVPPVDVAPLERALERGFASLSTQLDRAFAEIEKECVELALAAAERIVRVKVARGELDLESPLKELLAARRRELAQLPSTLRANPEDARALLPKLAELAPPGAKIELVADPAQPRGDLALELGAARIVRSIDADLARLRQKLFEGARR